MPDILHSCSAAYFTDISSILVQLKPLVSLRQPDWAVRSTRHSAQQVYAVAYDVVQMQKRGIRGVKTPERKETSVTLLSLSGT